MTLGTVLGALSLLLSCDTGTDPTTPQLDARVIGMPDAEVARDATVDGTTPDARPPVQTDARMPMPPDAALPGCNEGAPTEDIDGDGFAPVDGDCDECSPQINPGAYDVPGNVHDEDCDGVAAEEAEPCQQSLPLSPASAEDAARAMGLCRFTSESEVGWGVLGARFTRADRDEDLDSSPQVGVLPSFGTVEPLEGGKLLALSSGVARAPGQEGYTANCDSFPEQEVSDPTCGCSPIDVLCIANCVEDVGAPGAAAPEGYPKRSSECGPELPFQPDARIFDQAGLELTLRVPTNARGLAFNSAFFTSEYPVYVCAGVNDFFVVFKTPRTAGASDDNILFDANGDSVGVDSGLLAVCDPDVQNPTAPRQLACSQGTEFLEGTGYGPPDLDRCGGAESGASTGWLETTTPVRPGETITLLFLVWDTGDSAMDSTVIIDAFRWLVEEVDTEEPVEVVTETVPVLI